MSIPFGPKRVVTHFRETSPDYLDVVARLSENWRVIICKDGIQWIAQRRRGREWLSVHYCITRDALIRLCDTLCERIDANTSAILLALPGTIAG